VDASSLVRGLYEAYQDRDWVGAARLLHAQAVVVMPATAERLVGREAIVSFQTAYPEPWGMLTVSRVLADKEGAAAQISVVDPSGQHFVLAAFWTTREGLLSSGVEYWVTIGAEVPPQSRLASKATKAATKAWQDNAGFA